MKEAKRTVDSWGGKLIFVYLPTWYAYGSKYDSYGIKVDANYLLRQNVLAGIKELGIPLVDIQSKVFDPHPDPVSLYNFRVYGHYTLEGYRRVTRELEKYIRENTVLLPGGGTAEAKATLPEPVRSN